MSDASIRLAERAATLSPFDEWRLRYERWRSGLVPCFEWREGDAILVREQLPGETDECGIIGSPWITGPWMGTVARMEADEPRGARVLPRESHEALREQGRFRFTPQADTMATGLYLTATDLAYSRPMPPGGDA